MGWNGGQGEHEGECYREHYRGVTNFGNYLLSLIDHEMRSKGRGVSGQDEPTGLGGCVSSPGFCL